MKNLEHLLTDYVTSLTTGIVTSAGYSQLAPPEQTELTKKLEAHFESLIIETFLNRIDPDAAEELQVLLESDEEKAFDRIEEMAAVTPGLLQDIEDRLSREAQVWRELG